jgi:hypothetical protein
MESGFQSSKPPTSSDTSRLGGAARFNLSAMDLPVSMNGRFQLSPAAGQLLPSARTADLSKDREIFNSDDDDNDLPCEADPGLFKAAKAGDRSRRKTTP